MGAPPRTHCKRGHDMSASRRRHPNGDSYCYECKLLRYKAWRKANPEKASYFGKVSRLRKKGLSLAFLDSACGICKTLVFNGRGPHIDHDHQTGEIRGVLCHSCNTGLGSFKDDVERLQAAINYLQKSRKK